MNCSLLLVNLDKLGELRNGCKLNTRNDYFEIDQFHPSQGFLRFLRSDDRKSTLKNIKLIISDVEYIISKEVYGENMLRCSRIQFLNIMKKKISKSITGLFTLNETYESDNEFKNLLDIELNKLNLCLKYIENELKENGITEEQEKSESSLIRNESSSIKIEPKYTTEKKDDDDDSTDKLYSYNENERIACLRGNNIDSPICSNSILSHISNSQTFQNINNTNAFQNTSQNT